MFKFRKNIKKLFFGLLSIVVLIIIGSVIFTSLYPLAYTESIDEYSKEYNVDQFLIFALINVESKYDKKAISQKEAKGLMQIGTETGEWASQELNIENYNPYILFDPDTNIQIGTWYLNKLISEFGNDADLVLAAYNAGSGNVQKWIKDEKYSHNGKELHNIPFEETENYLESVKSNYKIYKLVYKNYIEKPNSYYSKYIKFINYIIKYAKQI